MKKVILILALALVAVNVSAQQKGDWWMGGSLTYDYSKTDGVKNNQFTIAPYAEYCFADNWSFYFGGNYTTSKVNADNKSSLFGPSLGMLKYFPVTEKFYFYAELGGHVAWGSGKFMGAKFDQTQYQLHLTPGMAYRVAPRTSLYITLGEGFYFQQAENKFKDTGAKVKNTQAGFNLLSSGLTVGVEFRLNCR